MFPGTTNYSSISYIANDITNGVPFGAWGSPAVTGDITGAGTSDVLWYGATNGGIGYWARSK
jgi:hypothetical protein